MLKEIKLAIYIISISLFIFLIINHYFSDTTTKNYFRKLNNIDEVVKKDSEKLIILESNTEDIIKDTDKNYNKNKKDKKFSFWELLGNND